MRTPIMATIAPVDKAIMMCERILGFRVMTEVEPEAQYQKDERVPEGITEGIVQV